MVFSFFLNKFGNKGTPLMHNVKSSSTKLLMSEYSFSTRTFLGFKEITKSLSGPIRALILSHETTKTQKPTGTLIFFFDDNDNVGCLRWNDVSLFVRLLRRLRIRECRARFAMCWLTILSMCFLRRIRHIDARHALPITAAAANCFACCDQR